MNFRVSLLLVVVVALVTGAFAISWDDSRSPPTVGQSNPAHQPLAQALPPKPDYKQIAQAKPPAPELAPSVTVPADTGSPDATPATEPSPAITAEQPQADKLTVAETPKGTSAPGAAEPAPAHETAKVTTKKTARETTPAVTAAPSGTGTPDASRPAATEPAPVVTAPPPATGKPAAAGPATQESTPVVRTSPETGAPAASRPAARKPAPVVTAPPPATDKPVMAEPADKKAKPVVATPPPATDRPAVATSPGEQPTPVVTAPPPADRQQAPAPVVAAPPPTTDTPATAGPAEKKPTPVVTAPPQTEKPATETAPVVAAPAPPEKPVVVMTPLPEKRPDTSEAALAKNRPAKYLFGAKQLPSNSRARAIGYYPKGCLAGAAELAVDGPYWQAMRLSRNRNWGHPELVRFVERFAERAARDTGWPGILVGDLSQPRGGPTPFGHRSHQTGLDVDVWFMPMPEKRLSRKQREKISAPSMVASNGKELNPKTWTPETAKFIRAAAEQPGVERVLVNAAIKKELCRLKGKKRWPWMAKVRPWYGHDDHIHVRLECPADSPHCRSQPAVPGGDGCSNKELAHWFSDRVLHPKLPKHPKPRKQTMLADLPAACKLVLSAPDKKSQLASDRR